MNDDLTRQRSALLFNARKLKRDRLIQDVWSSDGNSLRTTPDEFITFTDSITQYSAFVNWIPNTQPVRYSIVAGYSPYYMELNSQQRAGWIFVYSCVFGFCKLNFQYPASSIYRPRCCIFATLYGVEYPTPSLLDICFSCVFGFCYLNSQYPVSSIFDCGCLFATSYGV